MPSPKSRELWIEKSGQGYCDENFEPRRLFPENWIHVIEISALHQEQERSAKLLERIEALCGTPNAIDGSRLILSLIKEYKAQGEK